MILDWIADNPSTMSEASGIGVKEWSFFLSPERHRPLQGLQYLGTSKALRYRYVQPETRNSAYFLSFLDERAKNLTALEPPSLGLINSEFVPPSADDLWKHVAGFGTAGPDGSQVSGVTYAALLRELRDVESWGPMVTGWLDPQLLAKIKVPATTSPGIRWKKMGYRTKREALMPAIREASLHIRRMVEGGTAYTVPPCGVAGRGKRMDIDRVSGAKKEGRLIVMPDLVHHLLGTMASGAYLQRARKVDKSRGGILLGMGPLSDNYQMISDWCDGAESFFFIDFSGFDQKVPAAVLRKCMGHVASRFEPTPGSRSYWEAQERNLINTQICMPDGSVYEKRRGVASGDPWTSIAGSYANWLVLKRACNRMGLRAKIWTFGDDSIIAVWGRKLNKDDLDTLSRYLVEEFGMIVSPEKSYVSQTLVDIETDPEEKQSGSFLSMYFLATPTGVRPTRPLQDAYELLMVPERNRESLHWEVTRTSMAYLTFYYNDNARYLIEEYWDWLHERHRIPALTGTASDIQLLREMDIPWSSFRWEWLSRLPRPGEVELLYKYGHTGFYAPPLWGAWYRQWDDDPKGNQLSFRTETYEPGVS